MIGIALEKPGQFIAVDAPPPAPAPGDALVRVHRIGICGTDLLRKIATPGIPFSA